MSERNGILMVLSPAKTMDLTRLQAREFVHLDVEDLDVAKNCSANAGRQACDERKTAQIVNEMKSKSDEQLKALLKLSPKLVKLARGYWADFELIKADTGDDIPAIYTFAGPAFQGLNALSCDVKTLTYLATNLFILDPVHGVVPALEGIQPYRLEMGVKGVVSTGSLSAFWKDSVTTYLGGEIDNNSSRETILLNLASDEYAASIDPKKLPAGTMFVKVVFKTGGRVLAVHAKRARGLMAKFVAEREATTLEEVSRFNEENYSCMTVDGNKWETTGVVGDNVKVVRITFDRRSAPANSAKRSSDVKKGGKKKAKN